MDNKHMMAEAKRAIEKIFANSDVSAETTADDLKEVKGEIDTCLECLRADGVEGA